MIPLPPAAYRKLIELGILLAIAAALVLGFMAWRASLIEQGRQEVQTKWDAEREAQRVAVETAKAQAAADVKIAFEVLDQRLQGRTAATDAALKGLANEIKGNRAYTDCRITDNGLRLYREAGGTAAGTGQDTGGEAGAVPGPAARTGGFFYGLRPARRDN